MNNNNILRIDYDEIQTYINNINTAFVSYKIYSHSFIKQTKAGIESMKSDYLTYLAKNVLANMSDSEAPKVEENIQAFINSLEFISKGFESMDKKISEKISVKESEKDG